MSREMDKFWGFIFAAITLLSAVFCGLAIEQRPIRYALLTTSVVSVLVAAALFLRVRKYDNAIDALTKALRRTSAALQELEVRPLKNEAELKEVWTISQEIYGDDNVEFDKVVSWWKCYPSGVYALFESNGIVGYLSMWPVKKRAYQDIIAGKRRERELSPQSILGRSNQKARPYWYITNIVVRKKFKKAIKTLITEAARRWLDEGNLDATINLCALGYSSEGAALLKRFGFARYKEPAETADQRPLYIYTGALGDLRAITKRLVD